MNIMPSAVLLAGGESKRFWPLKEKGVFDFCGKSFLTIHYEQLKKSGVHTCIVVVNPDTEKNIKSVPVPDGLTVDYAMQHTPGMGSAVAALETFLDNDPVIILNASDWYSDRFISDFFEKSIGKSSLAIGALKVASYFPGGYIRFRNDQTIEEIVEKPKPGSEPSDMVAIVADYFPKATDFITAAKKYGSSDEGGFEYALNKMIQSGHPAHMVEAGSEDWSPLKYPWHVLSVMEKILQTIEKQDIHSSVEIKNNVVIEGPVIIEENVKISEGTKIVGPCYIGKNTIIGNNNLIRSSSIGAGCMTGFNSDITRSYIGANCWFHTNYVGDSVICDNVSMGSGTVSANLRLDDGEIGSMIKGEKVATGRNKLGVIIAENVRIGVNTSIMPGIKIGSGTFIGAGLIVAEDIEEKRFVFEKDGKIQNTANSKNATVSREEFRKKL